jgi:hypothetical protein
MITPKLPPEIWLLIQEELDAIYLREHKQKFAACLFQLRDAGEWYVYGTFYHTPLRVNHILTFSGCLPISVYLRPSTWVGHWPPLACDQGVCVDKKTLVFWSVEDEQGVLEAGVDEFTHNELKYKNWFGDDATTNYSEMSIQDETFY